MQHIYEFPDVLGSSEITVSTTLISVHKLEYYPDLLTQNQSLNLFYMDINAHTLQELGLDLYKITKPGDLIIPEYILCFLCM